MRAGSAAAAPSEYDKMIFKVRLKVLNVCLVSVDKQFHVLGSRSFAEFSWNPRLLTQMLIN